MAELKPCPFCGSSIEAWEHTYPSGDTYFEPLGWHGDGCILSHVLWCNDFETEEELTEAWNTRVGEQE